MDDKLLDIKNLSVAYNTYEGTVRAVRNASFSVGSAQNIGLVGESGAGKTTTALAVMRLVPDPPGKITNGGIYFQGRNLCDAAENEMESIRGNQISMIFQDPMTSLNPVLTIGIQIAEVVMTHRGLSKSAAFKEAQALLEKVHIPAGRYKEYPHEFSGGMRQRVGIAMALACNPSLIIADEPTSALDVTIQAQIIDLMRDLQSEFDTSMILITHDLGIVAEICDYVAVMYAGEIVETGSLEQIFTQPLHPYTIGLFKCVPRIVGNDKISPIGGGLYNPFSVPEGCSFHPRCLKKMPVCEQTAPDGVSIDGHRVRCHLAAVRRRQEK
ncbi:MAG: ABC transporter ATP-binding protein [Synergistaceae bacterium]|nr:ABC transporter ATP-binding protein [Synergistaceae bacterium]